MVLNQPQRHFPPPPPIFSFFFQLFFFDLFKVFLSLFSSSYNPVFRA